MLKPITPSSRVEGVKYAIRDVVLWVEEARKAGREIVPLNIGDPCPFDFDTPEHIKEAAYDAMRKGFNGYSASHGIPEAVEAITREAIEFYGIAGARNVFVSTGGSEAIDICLTALLEPGENVLVPAPGYPLYTAVIGKLRCEENFYFLNEDDGWQPDIDDIVSKINDKTRALVLINPNNPTGAVCTEEKLRQLIEVAREHGLLIMADEIYSKLIIDDDVPHVPIASLDEDVPIVTFNGLSKNYMSPGWRIGWAIFSGAEELMGGYIEAVNKLVRARLCANHPEQYAIKPALEGPQDHIEEARVKLRQRRDLTFQRLNEIRNMSCVKPLGAFYAFPRLHIDRTDAEWVRGLLMESGVLTVHGAGFGQVPGTRHIRIVFLPQLELLSFAYDKMEEYMEKHYSA